MKKTMMLMAILMLAVGFQACSKDKQDAPTGKATGDTAGQIGVVECDEYISKVQKCVADKVPESARALMKQGFEQNIKAWKQAASTPQGKQSLAVACKTALDTAKQSMGNFGCTF